MTTLTINQPTAAAQAASTQALAKATTTTIVKDSRGRALALRRPQVLQQYRLIEMLGDSASNTTYVSMVLPLLYVTAIDDDANIALSTKRELDALIQRLDEDGVAAVMAGVAENFGTPNPDETKAALKN